MVAANDTTVRNNLKDNCDRAAEENEIAENAPYTGKIARKGFAQI